MIYYIHGYLSSPQSRKGELLKEKLNAIPIKYRDCEPDNLKISECLKTIFKKIKNDNEVILIGSSFGGYLSLLSAVNCENIIKLILLNPSILPPSIDINNIHNMPKRILKEMINKSLFENKVKSKIFIILGTEDNVVPNFWSIEFAKTQEANVLFLNDDHRFSKNLNKLPLIINNIINQKN